MASLYKNYVDWLETDYTFAYVEISEAQSSMASAWTRSLLTWSVGKFALTDTMTAVDSILWCLQYIISRGGAGNHYHLLNILKEDIQYKSEDTPICGWKGIIEAWVKNDFEARTWTIATIDRMRQILWNEPFDVRWAARPELGAFI